MVSSTFLSEVQDVILRVVFYNTCKCLEANQKGHSGLRVALSITSCRERMVGFNIFSSYSKNLVAISLLGWLLYPTILL